MLVEDTELKTIQVRFDALQKWPEDYKLAIGSYIIAYSQWEHVLELLCKDLGLARGETFAEKLKSADRIILTLETIKSALQKNDGYSVLLDFIEQMEPYKEVRHLLVHGFHHVHQGYRITQLSKNIEKVGRELEATQVIKDADAINSLVNQLNLLRRHIFHGEPVEITSALEVLPIGAV